MSDLTHIDEQGAARMVAVDQKEPTRRRAIARGRLCVSPKTLKVIQEGRVPKGDVLAVARVAGIMAAKETSRLIPLCHPITLTGISINFKLEPTQKLISVEACVDAFDRTGVEMEALTAVSVATLTLYDMLKAIDNEMVIEQVQVTHKSGGKRDFTLDQPRSAALITREDRSSVSEQVSLDSIQEAPESSSITDAPSSSSGLAHSIRVVPKSPRESIKDTGPTDSRHDDDQVMTSCDRPIVKLLTPIEPISALNQTSPSTADHSDSENEEVSEGSMWEESMLANVNDHDLELYQSVSDIARQQSLLVREVSLSYPPLTSFIIKRPVECAYLLGYLSPAFTKRSRAFILETNTDEDEAQIPQIKALLFIYSGLTVPTVWTYGSEEDIEAILFAVHEDIPRRIYLNVEDHHYHVVRGYYRTRGKREILRMGLQRSRYTPVGDSLGVVSLGHPDTGGIMSLFQRYYADNLFEPAQLESGLYCGIKDDSGKLLSVAGIHLLNPDYRVAAIGNIVTDPDCRGRGYATKCVRHILDQLFEFVDSVALNVNEDNAPAIYCYQKFGFQTTERIIEAQARLR